MDRRDFSGYRRLALPYREEDRTDRGFFARGQAAPPLPPRERNGEKREFPRAERGQLLSRIRAGCRGVVFGAYGGGASSVIILPEAWEELRRMICFGQRAAVNCYEQQYQGMGHVFADEGRTHVVVSHFLYIYSASRSPVHASVVETERDGVMLDRLAAEREIYCRFEKRCNLMPDGRQKDPFLADGESETVLFGHTHPDLGCFFSPPDRRSGYATAAFPAVTFVCDPIRCDMKAMVGIHEEDAAVIVAAWKESGVPAGSRPLRMFEGAGKRRARRMAEEAGRQGMERTKQACRGSREDGALRQEEQMRRIAAGLLADSGCRGRYRIYRGKKGELRMKLWMRKKGEAK